QSYIRGKGARPFIWQFCFPAVVGNHGLAVHRSPSLAHGLCPHNQCINCKKIKLYSCLILLLMDCRFVPALILLAIIFPFYKTAAQTSAIQSVPDSFINARAFFQNEIKEDVHLYTGKEFIKYSVNIKGHPFFETDQMQNGTIFYDGTLYENVALLYDIVSQEIVINRYNSDERMKLLNEKIKYFTFDGYRFENIFSVKGKDENVSST